MPQIAFDITNLTLKPENAIVIDTWVLIVLLAVVLLVFIVISSVLSYHWQRFAFDQKRIGVMRIIYFIGSIGFLGTALTGIIMYSLSR